MQDLWTGANKQKTARHGRGKRWRVVVPGHPTRAFAVKADAIEWERELWSRPTPGTITAGVTVGECLTAHLAGKRHLSDGYTAALRAAAAHVTARWGSTPVAEVRRSDIQAWIAGLQAEHGPRGRDGARPLQPMAARTRARVLQTLRGALDVAVERGIIPANPTAGVSPGRPVEQPPRFLTPDEISQLAEAVGERWAGMVWLLATVGPRLGECVRLDVDDVDAARRRLLIRQSKSGRPREAPIPTPVLEMLDLTTSGPLFRTATGARVSGDNWRARVFHPARETLGWPELRIHDLRHTAASLMIASGADVKAVQAALGHASATMTLDRYGHLWDKRLDEVGDAMSALIGRTGSVPGGSG